MAIASCILKPSFPIKHGTFWRGKLCKWSAPPFDSTFTSNFNALTNPTGNIALVSVVPMRVPSDMLTYNNAINEMIISQTGFSPLIYP